MTNFFPAHPLIDEQLFPTTQNWEIETLQLVTLNPAFTQALYVVTVMPAAMEMSALENAWVVLHTMKAFGFDESLIGIDCEKSGFAASNEANNQFIIFNCVLNLGK